MIKLRQLDDCMFQFLAEFNFSVYGRQIFLRGRTIA